MQKSYRAPNPGDNRQWFLIDAKDQPLGRLAEGPDRNTPAFVFQPGGQGPFQPVHPPRIP